MEVIRLEGIRKNYNLGEVEVPVLHGVSLTIEAGEYVALMGSSGSGKSTLMNILGCLDIPSAGKYWLEKREVSQLSSDERARLRNSKIGFVFQSFNLLRRTSALDNVLMPLTYREKKIPPQEARERGIALLKRVGLGDRMNYEPSQLSGGQQQRVAVARALINGPSLLLADEPTGNLDSTTTAEILRVFAELNEKENITLLLVTHETDVAAHAQRIVQLHDGVVRSDTRNRQR